MWFYDSSGISGEFGQTVEIKPIDRNSLPENKVLDLIKAATNPRSPVTIKLTRDEFIKAFKLGPHEIENLPPEENTEFVTRPPVRPFKSKDPGTQTVDIFSIAGNKMSLNPIKRYFPGHFEKSLTGFIQKK